MKYWYSKWYQGLDYSMLASIPGAVSAIEHDVFVALCRRGYTYRCKSSLYKAW